MPNAEKFAMSEMMEAVTRKYGMSRGDRIIRYASKVMLRGVSVEEAFTIAINRVNERERRQRAEV